MKKILLIGGEGFLGKNIASILAKEYDCRSIDIRRSPFHKQEERFLKLNPYKESVSEPFDVFVHLIDHLTDPEEFENAERRLAENIGLREGSHLIVFSSAVIYANPASSYAKRKVALERFYEEHCREHNINLTIFRIFNVYGEFQIPYKQGSLIANLFFNHLNDSPTEVIDIEAKRDFMHAPDVGKFVLHAIQEGFFGKTDIATGTMISIKELLASMRKVPNLNNIKIMDRNVSEGIVCPAGKNELLGVFPLTSLQEGLEKTYEFYKTHKETLQKLISH